MNLLKNAIAVAALLAAAGAHADIKIGISLPLFPGDRQDQDISARYAERDAVKDEHEDARRAQREAVAASAWGVWI